MADIDPTTLLIADFPGFSTFVLASLHHDLPSSNESRAAFAELVRRKALPYDEWCRAPIECIHRGYCPRDPTCGD